MTGALGTRSSRSAWVLQGLLYLVWASTWPVGKWALQHWTSLGLIGVRHVLGGGLLLVVAARRSGARPASRDVAAVGLLQYFAYYLLSYAALGRLDAGTVALVSGTYPVFVALFAALGRVSRRPTARDWLALASVIFGSLLVARSSGGQWLSAASPAPVGLHFAALLAAFCLAIATQVTARALPSGATIQEVSYFVGAAMLVGGSAAGLASLALGDRFTKGGLTWAGALTVGYLTLLGSCAVFVVHTALLRRQAAWKVAAGYPLVPALSLLLSAVLLGERPSVRALPGIALLFAGLLLLAFDASRKVRDDAP